MSERISAKDFKKYLSGSRKKTPIAGAYRSKWSGKATVAGREHYFRSLWEYQYCCYLEWLKSNGEIIEWEFEPKLFKFPKKDYNAGPFQYLPDFRVSPKEGAFEWHEVKGWMSPNSKKKLKRFHKHFPKEGPITVIGKEWFKEANKRKLNLIVPGWVSLGKIQVSELSGKGTKD